MAAMRYVHGSAVLGGDIARGVRCFTGLVAGALLMGCSGESGPLFEDERIRCGPGTVYVAGECVVEERDAGDIAEAGELPDVSEAPVDAGGEGEEEEGDAGNEVDASEEEDAAPDVAEDVTDASDEPGNDAGDADGSDDAGDGGAVIVGDPCPDVPMTFNCSDTCEPRSTAEECAKLGCGIGIGMSISVSTLPIVLRLPSSALATPSYCRCESGVIRLHFSIKREAGYSNHIRVRVNEPWGIRPTLGHPACNVDKNKQCVSDYTTTPFEIAVTSLDPNPPTRNLIIEEVASVGDCP